MNTGNLTLNYSYADGKQWAKAIFYLSFPFLLIMRITIFQRGRTVGNFATVDSYAAAQILIVGIIWIILLFSTHLKILLRKLSGSSVGLLMLFYVFCGISALWSPLKAYTLYRAFEILGVCLIIFFALDFLNSFLHAEFLVLGFSLVILINGIVGHGIVTGWQSMHANIYPMIAAMILVYCLAEFQQTTGLRRHMLLVCIPISFISLCVGTSSTANVATLCGLIVIGIVQRSPIRMFLILLLLLVLMLLLSGLWDSLENATLNTLFPGKSWEEVKFIQGRLDLWKRCWPDIMKRPLLGHGFAAAPRLYLGVVSAHNSFMDILLATGFIGLTFFGIIVAALLYELSTIDYHTAGYVGCCSVFTCAIVGSMGTSFIVTDFQPPITSLAMFAGLYIIFILPTRKSTNLYGSQLNWQNDFF